MEIDEQQTQQFNEYITSLIDDLIDNSNHNLFIQVDYNNNIINEYLENTLIYNMFGNSMDSILNTSLDEDKGLEKDDNIELKMTSKYEHDKCVECCICMDEDNLITKGCEVYNCSGCNNVFHKSCMNDWVKMKVECPMCRKDLTDDVEHVDKFEQWVLENIDI